MSSIKAVCGPLSERLSSDSNRNIVIPCYIETMSRPRLAVTTLFFMYTIDNVELHIRVITSHYRVITKISPGDNFYTVQLFPLIRPRSRIELSDSSTMPVWLLGVVTKTMQKSLVNLAKAQVLSPVV